MHSKAEIRELVWDKMTTEKVARFPFPVKGRIPNFKMAEKAAEHVFQLDVYQNAKVVKVNPDSPQLPVRAQVIKDEKTLLVPTPRLKDGFIKVEPENVPLGEERKAVALKNILNYGEVIPLTDLPRIDLFFAGSVALHRDGRRIGKGEGYADREYAILQELGNPPIPVIGTVHSVQLVEDDIPIDEYDLTLDYIATEKECFKTSSPYEKPNGITWERVTEEDFELMPVLAELKKLKNDKSD